MMATYFLLLCEVLLICISGAQQQCRFNSDEGKILACGVGTSAKCLKIQKMDDFRTILINHRIGNFHHSFYDVHAYRLCGTEQPKDVSLADAMSRGELCQGKTKSGIFKTLTFQGCDAFFTADSNKDLTIYAYEDVDGCNGDLLYRFLLINGTALDSSKTCSLADCPANSHCEVHTANCSHECFCNEGYDAVLHNDSMFCRDVDECSGVLPRHGCGENAFCVNTEGGFNCTCHEGFTGNGFECTDVDECNSGSDDCHDLAECINTPGSFTCSCRHGYTGNGTTCSDIDECSLQLDSCNANEDCINTEGGFECMCEPGFTGVPGGCTDVNECVDLKLCGEEHSVCRNLPGSYVCECLPGFARLQSGCEDIDECEGGIERCTVDHSHCTNTLGSFTCDCDAGYMSEDGKCRNDCLEQESMGRVPCPLPNQVCRDTTGSIGSYICECQEGHVMTDVEEEGCKSVAITRIENTAPQLFAREQTRESVDRALELVDSVVSVIAGGSTTSRERSVTSDLLKNTTSVLLDFQEEGGEAITVNESLVIVEVLDNLLAAPAEEGEKSDQVGVSIIASSENYGKFLLESDESLTLATENIVIESYQIDCQIEDFQFPTPEMSTNSSGDGPAFEEGASPARIMLPQQLCSSEPGYPVSVANLLIKNVDQFFPSTNATSRPVSAVLSSQVSGDKSARTISKHPAVLEFMVNVDMEDNMTNMTNTTLECVFLLTRKDGSTKWSKRGITTEILEDGRVRCITRHLTSFAVLLSVTAGVDVANDKFLQVLSKMTLTFSLICLFLAIVFFISYGRVLFTHAHYFVHLNLCIAMFFAFGLFLFADLAIGKSVPCIVMTALLNYFFLAVFCWMLCESVMLYLLLVVVFSKLSKRWWFFLLLGWGPPLLIFAVTYGAFRDSYVRTDYAVCWLAAGSGYYTIYMFIAPVGIIVLLNLLFLALVIRSLCKTMNKKRKSKSKSKQHDLIIAQAKAILVLLPLIGVTSVFGFLVFNKETAYVFGVLSSVFNGLQGVFIFFFHVLRSDRIWGRMKKKYGWFSTETQSSAAPSSVNYISPRERFGALAGPPKSNFVGPMLMAMHQPHVDIEAVEPPPTPPPPPPLPPPPPPPLPVLPLPPPHIPTPPPPPAPPAPPPPPLPTLREPTPPPREPTPPPREPTPPPREPTPPPKEPTPPPREPTPPPKKLPPPPSKKCRSGKKTGGSETSRLLIARLHNMRPPEPEKPKSKYEVKFNYYRSNWTYR